MWKGQCFLRRSTTVIGWHAGNSVARPGHLFNPVRRFMRKKLSNTKRQSLRPVEDVDGTSRGFRNLVKPFAFAIAVTGVSYTEAVELTPVTAIVNANGVTRFRRPREVPSTSSTGRRL